MGERDEPARAELHQFAESSHPPGSERELLLPPQDAVIGRFHGIFQWDLGVSPGRNSFIL